MTVQYTGDTTWFNVVAGIFAVLIGIIAYFYFKRRK
jgi:LPXTG-motif cell wall-anchored protein